MTADSKALVWGSALLGFAPVLCLFFQITFPKAQLIIVFITAAFFFLLSTVTSAILWFLLDPLIGFEAPWAAILPGVISQFLFRCAFVNLYHKVEHVIQQSIRQTEQGDSHPSQATEVSVAKLKLELNDMACGLAAGTGYGGMHAVLFFGSLLASESGDIGVLYQPSCPAVPSLFISAIQSFLFCILDVFWMLFTFFGIRRRLIFPRGGGTLTEMIPERRAFGGYLGNTRSGGNAALFWVLLSHTAAAFMTTFNRYQHGCAFSLTLLPVVTLVTVYGYWSGVSRIYLPQEPNSTQRLSLPASMSYGSRAEAALNGDGDDDDDDDDEDEDDMGQDDTQMTSTQGGDDDDDDDTNFSSITGTLPSSRAASSANRRGVHS